MHSLDNQTYGNLSLLNLSHFFLKIPMIKKKFKRAIISFITLREQQRTLTLENRIARATNMNFQLKGF